GPSASRGTPGTAMAARIAAWGSNPMSGRLQIGLPGVDRDFHGRITIRAPKLAAIEAHGVEPLRIFASAGRVAVRENMKSNHTLDGADMTAHIAWQPCVGEWIDIFRPDALAGLERCRRVSI